MCVLASVCVGCARSEPRPQFEVAAGDYARAFEAAKRVLRDSQFELERIDAREGVITAAPRPSSGFATPWIGHGTTFGDGTEGLAHFQQRSVRIEFQSVAEAPSANQTTAMDLRTFEGPVRGNVTVSVERFTKPGRRVDSTSVDLLSFAEDPEALASGAQPAHTRVLRDDPELAGRIARLVEAGITPKNAENQPVSSEEPASAAPSNDAAH